MVTKDQSYWQTYARAKKIAPHINDLLIHEKPALRIAIERESRALLHKYEPGRSSIHNVVETLGGLVILGSPVLILTLGYLEKSGFREHAHLLSLGGIGVITATAIALVDDHYQSKLYRAFAYVQRQIMGEQQASKIDVPYAKDNLEKLI